MFEIILVAEREGIAVEFRLWTDADARHIAETYQIALASDRIVIDGRNAVTRFERYIHSAEINRYRFRAIWQPASGTENCLTGKPARRYIETPENFVNLGWSVTDVYTYLKKPDAKPKSLLSMRTIACAVYACDSTSGRSLPCKRLNEKETAR